MFLFWSYMIVFFSGNFVPVTAGFCEGGHICSTPRECCTQGCCPPYQTGPRKLTPATDHVLNLFFISHWYFWCVVVALVLAFLCAYSLWKKRRQLCGLGSLDHVAQSEGDSTGSCYAPPQYSRCNSFHHPPPPYGEVTSKPDLYPLVFTSNSDNNKSGGSYLMVQYFRNLIVRPVGSLSATSTVDSLSSSFICNANEANLLVPPPYSRAASPDIGVHSHFMLPRSASQLVCPTNYIQQISQQEPHIRTTSTNFINNDIIIGIEDNSSDITLEPQRGSDTNIEYFPSVKHNKQSNNIVSSHSDQQLKFLNKNNFNNFSEVFINNNKNNNNNLNRCSNDININNKNSNNHHQIDVINNINHNKNNNSNNSNNSNNNNNNNNNKAYNSIDSDINGLSINTIPAITSITDNEHTEYRDILLCRSLETSCLQLMPSKQQINQKLFKSSNNFNENNAHSQLSVNQNNKKYINDGNLQNYLNSNTCSIVSSLANIGSPNSPPQATSPTSDSLDITTKNQSFQLHKDNRLDEDIDINDFNINNANYTVIKGTNNSTLQNKNMNKKLFSKSKNSMYIPIINSNANNLKSIRSPVSSTSFFVKNRVKRNYNSKSAPTTPGCLPSNFTGDDNSPLLNEYDEDAEYNA